MRPTKIERKFYKPRHMAILPKISSLADKYEKDCERAYKKARMCKLPKYLGSFDRNLTSVLRCLLYKHHRRISFLQNLTLLRPMSYRYCATAKLQLFLIQESTIKLAITIRSYEYRLSTIDHRNYSSSIMSGGLPDFNVRFS